MLSVGELKVAFLGKYNSVYLVGKCLSIKGHMLAKVPTVGEQAYTYSEQSQPAVIHSLLCSFIFSF